MLTNLLYIKLTFNHYINMSGVVEIKVITPSAYMLSKQTNLIQFTFA